ncbi:adhesin, partial [Escherichia coli]|nr:adhesin [Escherichia coli]
FGSNATATGAAAQAFGVSALASGTTSLAIGVGAEAAGDSSISLGPVSNAGGDNSVAIGMGASSSNDGDVALGSEAKTTAVTATTSGIINNKEYTYAGTSPVAALSIGDTGKERQLQNVAAGRISGISTDAVNGSQLFATNSA